MRSRIYTSLAVAATSAAALAIVSQAPVAASVGASANACGLVSKAHILQILGLRHVTEHVVSAPGYPADREGGLASICLAEAWRGAKPRTTKMSEVAVADGAGAEFTIETVGLNPAAAQSAQEQWTAAEGGYEHQLTLSRDGPRVLLGILNPHGLRGSLFAPPSLGAQHAEGFLLRLPKNGLPHHIWSGSAYWAFDTLHAVIDIGLIEGTRKVPVRKKLEQIAKTIVPAFGI